MFLMIAAVMGTRGAYEKAIHESRNPYKNCTQPEFKQDQTSTSAEIARKVLEKS